MDLVLGTAQWGLAYGIAGGQAAVGEGEVRRILEAASVAGVCRIDTAQAYGDIEPRLPMLLPAGVDWRITTKIPRLPTGIDACDVRSRIDAAIEQSHALLGGRLEAVLLHDPSVLLDPALGPVVWDEFLAACRRRDVRAGASVYSPDELQVLLRSYPIEQAQLPGNALDQRLADMPETAKTRVARDLRSVFLQGLLLSGAAASRLPAAQPALARWRAWCNERQLEPVEAALGLVRGLDPTAQGVVVGVDSVGHFQQIERAWSKSRPLVAPELRCDDLGVIDPRRWRITT